MDLKRIGSGTETWNRLDELELEIELTFALIQFLYYYPILNFNLGANLGMNDKKFANEN